MECRDCSGELDAEARFCPACGAPVDHRCSGCGGSIDADARFCKHCGLAVATPDGQRVPTPLQERKVVALLFADIVGFTELGLRHDPETISAIVNDLFGRLSAEVARYEGTVEKFAGDAMLAVFGVPTAHEDDAERAVRAALEMQSVVATRAAVAGEAAIALRIGVESGEVLVDLARANDERDLFVTGEAVNTAARLETAAEAGTVYVGPSAYAATRDVIDYAESAPVDVKGKGIVAAWRAISTKARRGGIRAPLGPQAAMVGRDRELAGLKELVWRATGEGRPYLTTVLGGAGVGKSRLVWELEKYLDGLPERYHWRKGRCLAYGAASFAPVAEIVRTDAAIVDEETPSESRDKLARRLEVLAPADADVVAAALEAVAGIGSGESMPREGLFESWRRYLEAIARVAPLVIVFEDIHWADEGTLDFIEYLTRWSDAPMVIVCVARSELLEKRPTWAGGQARSSTMSLDPLGERDNDALIAGLLRGAVPSEVSRMLTRHAEGNPLFTEELIRMLVDRGDLFESGGRWELDASLDVVEVPRSVQAVLAARLDSLPAEEKHVAQNASVIGRVFWESAVAYISRAERQTSGQAIRGLRGKDLIVAREPSMLAGSDEFGFRHVLIRDVAYDGVTKRDRARLHRQVASWARTELVGREQEFVELIATHLASALRLEIEVSADGDDVVRLHGELLDAALAAARRAIALSQLDKATLWFRTAIDQSAALGQTARQRATLADEFAQATWKFADPGEGVETFGGAADDLALVDDLDDADLQLLARLRVAQATAAFDMGDTEGARHVLVNAIEDPEGAPASPGRSALLACLAWTYWREGEVERAIDYVERAVVEAEATGSDDTLRWAIHDLGVCRAFMGDFDEAVSLIERSRELAEAADDSNLIVRCDINLPEIRELRGDPLEEVIAIHRVGLASARRTMAISAAAEIAGTLADFLVSAGDLREALALADEAVEAGAASGIAKFGAFPILARSSIRRLLGDESGARADAAVFGGNFDGMEPQQFGRAAVRWAWDRWADDPATGVTTLRDALRGDDRDLVRRSGAEIGLELMRMAIRIDDEASLRLGERAFRAEERINRASQFVAEADWVDGLAARQGADISAAAAQLERLGRLTRAVEAYADAALVDARQGRRTDAEARAVELARQIGSQPVLGPLPETRWLVHPASVDDRTLA